MILCPCIWQRLSGKTCCQWKVLLMSINHNVSSIGDEGLPIYRRAPFILCVHRESQLHPKMCQEGESKKLVKEQRVYFLFLSGTRCTTLGKGAPALRSSRDWPVIFTAPQSETALNKLLDRSIS